MANKYDKQRIKEEVEILKRKHEEAIPYVVSAYKGYVFMGEEVGIEKISEEEVNRVKAIHDEYNGPLIDSIKGLQDAVANVDEMDAKLAAYQPTGFKKVEKENTMKSEAVTVNLDVDDNF